MSEENKPKRGRPPKATTTLPPPIEPYKKPQETPPVTDSAPSEEAKPAKIERRDRSYVAKKTVDNDRFRVEVAEVTVNVSWQATKPKIEKDLHRHYFNIRSRRDGSWQKYTEPMRGHVHEVFYDMDKDGKPVLESVKLGPALKQSTKKVGDKSYTSYVPSIVWKHKDVPQDEWIRDEHTHEINYWRTEKMEIKA